MHKVYINNLALKKLKTITSNLYREIKTNEKKDK